MKAYIVKGQGAVRVVELPPASSGVPATLNQLNAYVDERGSLLFRQNGIWQGVSAADWTPNEQVAREMWQASVNAAIKSCERRIEKLRKLKYRVEPREDGKEKP